MQMREWRKYIRMCKRTNLVTRNTLNQKATLLTFKIYIFLIRNRKGFLIPPLDGTILYIIFYNTIFSI